VASLATGCAPEVAQTPPVELGPDGLPVIDTETPLPDPLPTVAARVNGEDVQTRNVLIIAEARLRRKEITDRIVAYRRALQEVIARELLLQEALARGLAPDPQRLQQVYDETRAGYRDDASWELYLGQEGLDEELFRKELRVQHTVNALIDEVAGQDLISISDEEARAFYDDNPELFETGDRLRARHVLIRAPATATGKAATDAEARLQEARRRVVQGEDFGAVAREVSEDAGSRGRGGEVAVFSRGEVPPRFLEVVSALEPGQLSLPFRSSAGYHFAELLERLPSERRAFNDVREAIKQQLAARQRQQRVQDLVNDLRRKASIQTFI
jgi:peptidyl-prolyl cis-trans isomerase C